MTEHEEAVVEEIAKALVQANEQNGGPPWDWYFAERSREKHALSAIYDQARAVSKILDREVQSARREAIEAGLAVIDEWLDTDTMKLRAGEMSAQEVRTAKAILNSVRAAIRRLSQEGPQR